MAQTSPVNANSGPGRALFARLIEARLRQVEFFFEIEERARLGG